jgi:hypothetical protein
MDRLHRARRFAAAATAAALALAAASCGAGQPQAPPDATPAARGGQESPEVTMGAPRAFEETVSPAAPGTCAIDATKICRVYGPQGPPDADRREVSIAIPNGPVVVVQCRYSGIGGGALASAAAQPVTLDPEATGFMASHGFCLAPPGGS